MKGIALGMLVFAIVFSVCTYQDAYAHHVLQKIQVTGTPMSMNIDDGTLYVSSFEYPRVSMIDINNNKETGFITISSSGIMDIEPVPDKNKIYVAPFESGGIDVYTLSTKLLIKTIPLPESEITIQTTSNQPYGHRSDLHFLTGGWSLDYNPTTELLYVADYNSNLIYVIDGKTDEVIETVPVPRHPFTVRVDPVNNNVIVASLAGNEISFIEQLPRNQYSSGPVHEVTDTIKVSGGPWGLELDPIRHLAYVTNRGCQCITVVNTLEKEIVGNIPLGDRAQSIAVDTSEHQVFVSYLTQNKIVKIDGNTDKIVSIWDVASTPWDLEVDPNTHKFYASLKSTNEILVLGPQSVSMTLPVLTLETPSTFLDLVLFHGQDVTASNAFVNTVSNTLVMDLQTEDGGKVALHIPRNVLDAKKNDGSDARFEISVDGKIVSHDETKLDQHTRVLSLQIPRNAQSISVSGTISAQDTGESMQSKADEDTMMSKEIVCEDKVWVESSKGKIACVTSSTAMKLVERGWGMLLE
jgi:YVTN family beta-propeller protein